MPAKLLKVTPLMNGKNVVALGISGTIPLTAFGEDREGRSWEQPLRARGNRATVTLAGQVVDGKWIMPDDYKSKENELLSSPNDVDEEGNPKPLYVCEDGTLTPDPYIAGTRQVAPFVLKDAREATDWRQFQENLEASIVWPDGLVRKMRLTIKANNAMTEKALNEVKSAKAARLQASTLRSAAKTPEQIDRLIAELTKMRQQGEGAAAGQ